MNRTTREILQLLRVHGRISRAQLAAELGLTRMAIGTTVDALLKAGILEPVGMSAAVSRGRPSEIFQATGKKLYCFGISVDRFSIHLVILDWFNNTVACRAIGNIFRTGDDASESATDQVLALLDQLMADAGIKHVVGGALAFSSDCHDESGRHIVAANDFQSVEQANEFLEKLKSHTGVPIWLERDVDAALLAERWSGGQLPQFPNMFYINDRLGFAMMLDGKPWRGPADSPRWLGRVQVDPNGVKAPGFPDGSIYSRSLGAIIDQREGYATGTRPTSLPQVPQQVYQDVFDLYEKQDPETLVAIQNSFQDISRVVTNLIAMFSFDEIILDGWTPAILKDGIAIVQKSMTDLRGSSSWPKTIVRAAKLGASQQAVGAAISSFDHLLSSRKVKIPSATSSVHRRRSLNK